MIRFDATVTQIGQQQQQLTANEAASLVVHPGRDDRVLPCQILWQLPPHLRPAHAGE